MGPTCRLKDAISSRNVKFFNKTYNANSWLCYLFSFACFSSIQLMDMGFTREHAMESLLNTSTMEQATEYLLTHPPPLIGGVVRVSVAPPGATVTFFFDGLFINFCVSFASLSFPHLISCYPLSSIPAPFYRRLLRASLLMQSRPISICM